MSRYRVIEYGDVDPTPIHHKFDSDLEMRAWISGWRSAMEWNLDEVARLITPDDPKDGVAWADFCDWDPECYTRGWAFMFGKEE